MKRHLVVAILSLVAVLSVAAEAPLKVTVRQLLANPRHYDHRVVDVSGYYVCGMEDSDLWPNRGTAKRSRLEDSVYIDPVTWDPRFHPHRSRDILDPWSVTGHSARVVGTFRFRGSRPASSIPPELCRYRQQ